MESEGLRELLAYMVKFVKECQRNSRKKGTSRSESLGGEGEPIRIKSWSKQTDRVTIVGGLGEVRANVINAHRSKE